MKTFVAQYLLLEDAYFFLNQAKSLSDTPIAKRAKQRHLRASVLFAWQSLEYLVKDVLKTVPNTTWPGKFSARLELALKLRGSAVLFDALAYSRFYQLRNDVIHVNTGATQPTLLDAEALFTYCKSLHLELIGKGRELRIAAHPF